MQGSYVNLAAAIETLAKARFDQLEARHKRNIETNLRYRSNRAQWAKECEDFYGGAEYMIDLIFDVDTALIVGRAGYAEGDARFHAAYPGVGLPLY